MGCKHESFILGLQEEDWKFACEQNLRHIGAGPQSKESSASLWINSALLLQKLSKCGTAC